MGYLIEPSFINSGEPHIFHGFFDRLGGAPEYAREKAASFIEVKQVHGSVCLNVGAEESKRWDEAKEMPEADALVTDIAGVALAIKTADCAPVLFYASSNGKTIIGAAHAGWRGALGGVLDSVIEQMSARGAAAHEISACVGPTIGAQSYEVSQAFFDEFSACSQDYKRFFKTAQRQGHYFFDLPAFCAFRLHKAGLVLGNIFTQDHDTYANEAQFFSYRRATQRAEPSIGRQISMIMIDAPA